MGERAMNITMREVARLTNTSVATVSRVLNNKPGVSPERRARILEFVAEIGYHPNVSAQNLALRKSGFLGYIVTELGNPACVELFRHLHALGQEHGYHVLILDSRMNLDQERANLNLLAQQRAEGAIVSPIAGQLPVTDFKHFMEAKRRGLPCVLMGNFEGLALDTVGANEAPAAQALCAELIRLGHRRFGFAGVQAGNKQGEQRLAGCRRALDDAGLLPQDAAPRRPVFRQAAYHAPRWLDSVCEWFSEPEPPTALVAVNDILALRLYRPLRQRGLRIPEDLSIVAFGDSVFTAHLEPPLTVAVSDFGERARLAHAALAARIETPNAPPIVQHAPVNIIYRESHGPPPDA